MTYNSLVKEFTVYKHPKKDRYEAIKIGFAWVPFLAALFCGPILNIPIFFIYGGTLQVSVVLLSVWILSISWLAVRKLWLIFILCSLYSVPYNQVFYSEINNAILIGELEYPIILGLIYFVIWLIVGYKGNQWSHNKLKKKGYPIIKTVKARTRKSAVTLAKYLKKEDKEEEYQEVISENKECPMCAETVKARAKICRYCNHEFE
jgi:hypothetical protein